jgi:hypothetical protein
MSPATRQQFGPYSLNTERDADIIAALEAVGDGNKIGFVRACVRLAMNPPDEVLRMIMPNADLNAAEWMLIERARGMK